MPQSVGMIGGSPRHSVYFVGSEGKSGESGVPNSTRSPVFCRLRVMRIFIAYMYR